MIDLVNRYQFKSTNSFGKDKEVEQIKSTIQRGAYLYSLKLNHASSDFHVINMLCNKFKSEKDTQTFTQGAIWN